VIWERDAFGGRAGMMGRPGQAGVLGAVTAQTVVAAEAGPFRADRKRGIRRRPV
jgi:hypothetical protein